MNDLLSVKSAQLPDTAPAKKLCTLFLDFFESRLVKIRQGIEVMAASSANRNAPSERQVNNPLNLLQAASGEEVAKVIKRSKPKTSCLDALPTKLLEGTLAAHVPAFTELTNQSFGTDIVTTDLKNAVILSLLKKPGSDRNNYQNCRLVSNLSFVAKVVEKIASKRLSEHLERNNLHEELQSAYRFCHSPETVLLNVQHGIAVSLGNAQAVLLVLLDMLAAVDTIDGNILLRTPHLQFGVCGAALKWFESYMSGRTHGVHIGAESSEFRPLKYGVPQGSVLGLQLFCIYTTPLVDILKKYPRVSYHKFADDLQLYISYCPNVCGELESAMEELRLYIEDTRA